MALTQATLSAAMAIDDTKILVSAATGFAIGNKVRIDDEVLQVSKGYVASSTTVPLLRGQESTIARAHPVSAKVLVGAASDTGWGVATAFDRGPQW